MLVLVTVQLRLIREYWLSGYSRFRQLPSHEVDRGMHPQQNAGGGGRRKVGVSWLVGR